MKTPLRVLVVEDVENDAYLLLFELQRYGFQIQSERVETRGGLEAALDRQSWDLIISDFSMPHFSGPAALAVCHDRGVDVPFIIVSGTINEEQAVESMRAGAKDFITKGRLARLGPAVDRELRDARDRRARGSAEQALAVAEDRYKTLVEHMPARSYISMPDNKGSTVYVSPQIEMMTGFTVDEWLSDPNLWSQQLHAQDKERVLAEYQDAVSTRRPFVSEYRALTKDGRTKWWRDEAQVVDNGKVSPLSVHGFVVDITERKQAEEASHRLAAIVESSEDAIVASSLEGTILTWNRGAENLYGYSAGEMIGRSISVLMPPDRRDEPFEILDAIRKGEDVRPGGESIRRRKDGTEVFVSLSVSPLRNELGQLVGKAAIARDVSERVRLEQKFQQSQRMEAVGKLAGGVAHDFNNLLAVITGYSDLLLREMGGGPFSQRVEEIRKAADRAAGLTRQLLAFSRKQVFEPKVVDLNAVVADIEKMLDRLIGEDVHLEVRPQIGLGQVKADRGQIEQVIMNLAVNARDAMPQGGELTVETANAELDEAYAAAHAGARAGRYVMLAVTDTGEGMDAETQRHIFEPFFTTKELGKGTGLGLATVYGIVKQSEGYIAVDSKKGGGTTLQIYLPRIDSLTARPPEVAAEVESPEGSETILLAEDEESLRTIVSEILEEAGYTVLVGENPRQIAEVAQSHDGPIHLMLTDVIMPKISGRGLAEQITAVRPEIKVLYMSGYTDDAIAHHGVLKPGIHFIQKPFSSSALLRKVREVLDKTKSPAGE